jgi:hypothetical protein
MEATMNLELEMGFVWTPSKGCLHVLPPQALIWILKEWIQPMFRPVLSEI